MKNRLPLLSFLLGLFLVGGSVNVLAQCTTQGQLPVVTEICRELERAQIPTRVSTTKEFRLVDPRPYLEVRIEPVQAFEIFGTSDSSGTSYVFKIIRPDLLFTKEGELYFPVRVNIIIGTGDVGGIRIDADSRCETILEFRQADKPLNLERLGPNIEMEWIYPSAILSPPSVSGTQVRTTRLAAGAATLTLVLRRNGVEIARATRPVLECANLPLPVASSQIEITELMTPSRCYKPIGVRTVDIQNGQTYYYNVENVCSRPIECSWDVSVGHYTSAQEARDDLREGTNRRSRLITGEKGFGVLIPRRRSDGVNGQANGEFTTISTTRIQNENARNYWHTWTTARCRWFEL